MKKQTLKISTVSLLCVLCAGLNTNAIAAASVRTLGGTGTVNGTASAGTATRSAPRAGSLRVMPTSSQPASSTSVDKSASGSKPTSTTQRLSIGKYLGASTATTGSSNAGSAAATGDWQTAINNVENNLDGRISVLEGKDYMTEQEVNAAITAAQLSGGEVDLTAYETASQAEAKYQPKGDYLTEHQSLAGYETSEHASATYQPKGDYLTEHQSLADYATTSAVQAAIAAAQLDGQVDLSAYETASQAEAKYQPKGDYLTEHQSLAGYETSEHASATYQPKGDYLTEHQSLAAYETSAHAAETYQPKGDYLTEHQSLAAYETSAHAAETYQPKGDYLTEPQSLADYATTSAMQAAIAAAQLDGSDVDLSAYETSAQAEAKYQPKGD
ncbi:MAG: hypothetical protein J6W79_00660, partial [Alphaproteobacteria bacterium]|nr:hypothetical protein [Alphaproteobacteria bacterium]